ncbi:MAG: tetratricopeptide repeat protein [Patescibacteria group bacterium]
MESATSDAAPRRPLSKGLAASVLEKEARRIFTRSPSRALELIDRAFQHDRENFSLRIFYVRCLMRNGYNRTALRVAIENAQRWPNRTTYWQLSTLYLAMGDIEQALATAEKRLIFQPDCLGYENYAKMLMAAGRLVEAQTAIERSIQLDDADQCGDRQLYLAEILRKQRKFAEALGVLNQITSLKLINKKRICQAQCYIELKKYNSALALLQQSELQLNNEESLPLFDIRFRLYCCYIFLYEKLYEAGRIIQPYITGIASRAANWLRQRRTARLGQLQIRDFRNAMNIIARLQIK